MSTTIPRRGPLWRPIAAAVAAATLVAIVGGTLTELGPWYQALRTPSWQPPDWLFGPAWTVIFSCTAVAAALCWRAAPTQAAREWTIALFALNGALNVIWTALFFRLHRPDWSVIEVVALWLSVLLLIRVPARNSPAARWLLLPYLAWVAFAGWLNWTVVRLNAPFA